MLDKKSKDVTEIVRNALIDNLKEGASSDIVELINFIKTSKIKAIDNGVNIRIQYEIGINGENKIREVTLPVNVELSTIFISSNDKNEQGGNNGKVIYSTTPSVMKNKIFELTEKINMGSKISRNEILELNTNTKEYLKQAVFYDFKMSLELKERIEMVAIPLIQKFVKSEVDSSNLINLYKIVKPEIQTITYQNIDELINNYTNKELAKPEILAVLKRNILKNTKDISFKGENSNEYKLAENFSKNNEIKLNFEGENIILFYSNVKGFSKETNLVTIFHDTPMTSILMNENSIIESTNQMSMEKTILKLYSILIEKKLTKENKKELMNVLESYFSLIAIDSEEDPNLIISKDIMEIINKLSLIPEIKELKDGYNAFTKVLNNNLVKIWNSFESLKEAIGNDEVEKAIKIIQTGKINLNTKTKDGETLLIMACNNFKPKLIETLVNNGANVNLKDNKGNTPLNAILTNVDIPIEINESIINSIEFLIDKGADINVKNSFGETPLFSLVKKDFKSVEFIIKKFIENGASLGKTIIGENKTDIENSNNQTPLFFCKDLETARLLIDNGADVNKRDYVGRSILCENIQSGNPEIAMLLLEKGANPNTQEINGKTPLMVAIYSGYNKLIGMLVKNGADINLCNSRGKSPLMYAIESGDIKVVKFLIDKGADVFAVQEDGETVKNYAEKSPDINIKNVVFEKIDIPKGINHLGNDKTKILAMLEQARNICLDRGDTNKGRKEIISLLCKIKEEVEVHINDNVIDNVNEINEINFIKEDKIDNN